MPRTPFDDDDDDISPDDGEELDDDGEPFLPFDPEDMETFYDWEQDFPELDFMDEVESLDDSDFYEG